MAGTTEDVSVWKAGVFQQVLRNVLELCNSNHSFDFLTSLKLASVHCARDFTFLAYITHREI
jgi:hypothetical protein